MSATNKPDMPAARVAVKVPQPDSLVEVRVTPPESNFEVKVTPGEDVIELLIRPGSSLIEVRISPPGLAEADGRDVTGAKRIGSNGRDYEEGPAEDEVVTGVSRSEFAAMVEEEEASEAKKLLAQMSEDERLAEAAAQPKPAYELPDEVKKLLADDEPLDIDLPVDDIYEGEIPDDDGGFPDEETMMEAGPEDIDEVPADEPMAEDAEEEPAMEAGSDDFDEVPADEPFSEEAEEIPTVEAASEDILEIPTEEPKPEEPEEDLMEAGASDLAEEPDDHPEMVLTGEILDEEPHGDPTEPLTGEIIEEEIDVAEEAAPVEEPGLTLENDPADADGGPAPETPGSAAREALARLSAAVREEQSALAAGASGQKPDGGPDTTVMVELFEDAEALTLPESAPPLTEDEQMDLSPMERDEELAIDPIDVEGLENVDLETSRLARTVIKAKPMVKVVPGNTIVPE